MSYEETVSRELKGLRAMNSMSQDEVASRLGISRESYRKYENHPNKATLGILIEILKVYDVKPENFFKK